MAVDTSAAALAEGFTASEKTDSARNPLRSGSRSGMTEESSDVYYGEMEEKEKGR